MTCCPDHTLTELARRAGHDARLMWEIPGPKHTAIAWLSCYQIGHSICIVQTFHDGNGWLALTPNDTNDINATVIDVLARCGALPTDAVTRLNQVDGLRKTPAPGERGYTLTCGCCVGPTEDRCTCHIHQDPWHGAPVRKCSLHAAR